MSNDSAGKRRWQCPECQRSFKIPIDMATPSRCPDCRTRLETEAWYFREVGSDFGPFTRDYMRQLASNSQISADTLVRPTDSPDWRAANSLEWLRTVFPSMPQTECPNVLPEMPSDISKELESLDCPKMIEESKVGLKQTEKPTAPDHQLRNNQVLFVAATFLLIVPTCIWLGSPSDEEYFAEHERDQRQRTREIRGDLERDQESDQHSQKISAWVMAQQFVEEQLKSPSTASYGSVFGDYQDPDEVVSDLGGGRYTVIGWVDAQNSFGAILRRPFVCELKSLGDDKWRCLSLDFIGE